MNYHDTVVKFKAMSKDEQAVLVKNGNPKLTKHKGKTGKDLYTYDIDNGLSFCAADTPEKCTALFNATYP